MSHTTCCESVIFSIMYSEYKARCAGVDVYQWARLQYMDANSQNSSVPRVVSGLVSGCVWHRASISNCTYVQLPSIEEVSAFLISFRTKRVVRWKREKRKSGSPCGGCGELDCSSKGS